MTRLLALIVTTVVLLTPPLAALPLRRIEDDAPPKSSRVLIDTTMGKITVQLFPDKAPGCVKNFLRYVDDRFYDGTLFHRVIPNFMIQGGGYESGLREKKTRSPIPYEITGLLNKRGTIAMARTNQPDSATVQFFINGKDNALLDHTNGKPGYAVFGEVVQGIEVIDQISRANTGVQAQHHNVPIQDVIIRSIRRVAR